MLGLEGEEIHSSGAGWSPVYVEDSLGVMSIGFMLPNKDDAIIWRGPRKNSLIKQFVKVRPHPLALAPSFTVLVVLRCEMLGGLWAEACLFLSHGQEESNIGKMPWKASRFFF